MSGRARRVKRGCGVAGAASAAAVQRLEPRVLMHGGVGDQDGWEGLPPVAATAADLAPVITKASGPLLPLGSVPVLSSDSGAAATVYLDFHGEPAQAWGGQTAGATPAYDVDGDPTTFNAQEMANIREIWSRVSEAFSPFNVNVTTVDPGNWNLNGQGSSDHQVRAVIGGDGAWTGQVQGGIAYVGSYFASWVSNTVYVFPAHLANGNAQYTADDAVHEAGHAFGLQHQSTYNGTSKIAEYNSGNGTTAPFMGNPLSPGVRATWWVGSSAVEAAVVQDDLSVLSGAQDGFGYRAVTDGQSAATAATLAISGDTFAHAGIIETTGQQDYFGFATSDVGTDTFTVNVAPYGAMLHARLELHDAGDNVIAVAADAGRLSQTITATLPAGSYYVVVKSYGEYGDIGQYTLTGTVPNAAAPTAPAAATISGATGVTAGNAYTLVLAAVDSGRTIRGWTVNWGDGTPVQTFVGNPAGVDHVFAGAGSFTVSATMVDDAGSYASNALVVTASEAPSPVVAATLGPAKAIGTMPAKGRRMVRGRFTGRGSQSVYAFTLGQTEVVSVRVGSGRAGLSAQLLDEGDNVIVSRAGRRSVVMTMTLGAGTYYTAIASGNVRGAGFRVVVVTRAIGDGA